MLGIQKSGEPVSAKITKAGDSGALVLSKPSDGSGNAEDDVLKVYGIVIAEYSWKEESGRENSLTLANSLDTVIPEVFKSRKKPGDTRPVDFTQVANCDPNPQ